MRPSRRASAISCWLVGGSSGGGNSVVLVVLVLPPGGNVVVTVVVVVVVLPGSTARGARKRMRFSFFPRTVTCAASQAGAASVASSFTLRAGPQGPTRVLDGGELLD